VLARGVARACDENRPAAEIAGRVREAFRQHLDPHFAAEEELLLPALGAAGAGPLADRTLREHAGMRALLRRAEETGAREPLAAFAAALEAHIRFEERDLFEAAERLLPAEVLERLAARVPPPSPLPVATPQEKTVPEPDAIPPAEPLPLPDLLGFAAHGIASRVLARNAGGSVTLFAFEAGQALSEHTAPFDALVLVQEGILTLTIGGKPVRAVPGTVVRMPAHVPHALQAEERSRMLLVMLREPKAG
jgi:quercetin dioxygenase-like cupin family protein